MQLGFFGPQYRGIVIDKVIASKKHRIRKCSWKYYIIQEKEHVYHRDVKMACGFNFFS